MMASMALPQPDGEDEPLAGAAALVEDWAAARPAMASTSALVKCILAYVVYGRMLCVRVDSGING